MIRVLIVLETLILIFFSSCQKKEKEQPPLPDRFIVVMGIAQDAGYPQAGCEKECCKPYWERKEPRHLVTSLAMVNRKANEYWLFDATPDIREQLHEIQKFLPSKNYNPAGIFLTHAHIGHYTGLMQFGREVMGSKGIPVYAMPRMDSFLRTNGPWSQLVSLHNIQLVPIRADSAVSLTDSITVTAIRVPHRDEYSETVGYIIHSANKKVLFIPDIDKWEKWDHDIVKEIAKVDMALIDGTFYQNGELPGRDMSEVPHPFVSETMGKLNDLPATEKAKLVFIHFNHTNPLIKMRSSEKDKVKKMGFGVAEEGMVVGL